MVAVAAAAAGALVAVDWLDWTLCTTAVGCVAWTAPLRAQADEIKRLAPRNMIKKKLRFGFNLMSFLYHSVQ